MESDHGRKAIPPALLVGLSIPILWMLARIILFAVWTPRGFPASVMMTSEGVGFALYCMVIAGTLELHRRFTGTPRIGILVALAGVVGAFAADLVSGFGQFSGHWWEHKWIEKVYDYGGAIGWIVFAIGMTLAIPAPRRLLGFVAIVITFLTWPTEPLRDHIYGWLHLGRKGEMNLHAVLYMVRCANLMWLALFVNAGTTTPDPQAAASGFKLGAKALWLRVAAALSVSMLTLLLMAGRGNGGAEMLKLAMMAQGIISIIALAMFGAGMMSATRSAMPGLSSYAVVIGGAASLWAAGVSLGQLPHLYRILYSGDAMWGMESEREIAQALTITLPLVVTLGTALMATVLARFASFRGDSRLHGDATTAGIGYVVLMIVAVALQSWALPKATSISSLATMMLFAAGAGLWATILMAKLLASGAEAIESDPSLPTASVVNGPS